MSVGLISRLGLLVAGACLATTCATTPHALSVRQTTDRKMGLEGRVITVEGFLRFSPNSRNIWQSAEGYNQLGGEGLETTTMDSDADCLAVFDAVPLAARLAKFDRQYVRLTGRLMRIPLKKDEISLWECSDWGLSVKRVTAVQR